MSKQNIFNFFYIYIPTSFVHLNNGFIKPRSKFRFEWHSLMLIIMVWYFEMIICHFQSNCQDIAYLLHCANQRELCNYMVIHFCFLWLEEVTKRYLSQCREGSKIVYFGSISWSLQQKSILLFLYIQKIFLSCFYVFVIKTSNRKVKFVTKVNMWPLRIVENAVTLLYSTILIVLAINQSINQSINLHCPDFKIDRSKSQIVELNNLACYNNEQSLCFHSK